MIPLIINHLWQSTCFAAGIALVCYALRNDGAHIRFWLWWIASIKFLLPFSVLTWLGSALAGNAGAALLPEAITVTAGLVARPFAIDAGTWTPGLAVALIWAAGCLLVIARWYGASRRLRSILADSMPSQSIEIRNGTTVRVFRTEARMEPGIVGIFRPVLLLPRDIEQLLDNDQLEAIVSHELGHVSRRDNLLAAVHMLVETLFWFHPLVWWIGNRLVEERERACDELVVAAGHDKAAYAEGILDVCEHFLASPLRSAAGISGSDLTRRVTQIMRYQGMKSLKLIKKVTLGSAATLVIAAPLMVGIGLQRAAAQQADSAADSQGDAAARDEYLPIVVVAPEYPARAVERGLEGYVVLSYTVTETGSTENFVVIDSSSSLFEAAAIESASKYRYQPREVNGVPVALEGVTSRFVFELDPDDVRGARD